MKVWTRWSEADTKTKVLQVVMVVVAITVAINLFFVIPAIAAPADELVNGTTSAQSFGSFQAQPVQTVQAVAGTRCWVWTKQPPFSSTNLGVARARWSATLNWCGNNRTEADGGKVTSLLDKRCFDVGGGLFTYDPPVTECSRTALGQPSLRINEVLRYTYTTLTPIGSHTTVRYAHASIVLGPRGGVSGSWWWSA